MREFEQTPSKKGWIRFSRIPSGFRGLPALQSGFSLRIRKSENRNRLTEDASLTCLRACFIRTALDEK